MFSRTDGYGNRPVLLASLAAARRDPLKSQLTSTTWDLVVADKAHRLRSTRSASAKPHSGEGRLTLLGDAAHPMLPVFTQGAAQAIEDATRHKPYDVTNKHAEPQSSPSNNAPPATARSFQLSDGLRQQARDFVLGRFSLKRFDWLYGYDPDQAAQLR